MKCYDVTLWPNEFFSALFSLGTFVFQHCYKITFDKLLSNLDLGHFLGTDKKGENTDP